MKLLVQSRYIFIYFLISIFLLYSSFFVKFFIENMWRSIYFKIYLKDAELLKNDCSKL